MISLYTVPWESKLAYSSLQINLISSAGSLGSYLTPPILGPLSDSHGPVLLTWIAFFGFVPSYLYLAYVFEHGEAWFPGSVIAFFSIGVATSALFFSALLACAKLHPNSKLLSISFPTTFYGLSSVIGTQLTKLSVFQFDNGILNLGKVFRCFALFYSVVFFLTCFSTSTISMIKLKDLPNESEDERQALCPKSSREQFHTRISLFFKDPVAYCFLLVMILSLGIFEMFITDMGSITKLLLPYGSNFTVLPYFAVLSSVARLLCGLLIDLAIKINLPRFYILITFLITGLFSQFAILKALETAQLPYLRMAGILSGFTYGGLFTIFPALTLSIWGDAVFGTAYGTFMLGPAIGSTAFGIFYAKTYDSSCVTSQTPLCIHPVFMTTTVCIMISVIASGFFAMSFKKLRTA